MNDLPGYLFLLQTQISLPYLRGQSAINIDRQEQSTLTRSEPTSSLK